MRKHTGDEEDFDDIEAVGDAGPAQFLEIELGGADEAAPLQAVDGLARLAIAGIGAAFDFDKAENFALPADEVDFPSAHRDVAEQDLETLPLEKAGGDPLSISPVGAGGVKRR